MPADPVHLLASLGGSARTATILRLGCTRHALRSAREDGRLVSLGRGRYALPDALDPLRAAVRLGGHASHLSAAQHWGLEVVRAPARPHVTVGRRRSHLVAQDAVLHWADLAPADADDRVTSPLRTVLDCARSLPFDEGLAVVDSALRRPGSQSVRVPA